MKWSRQSLLILGGLTLVGIIAGIAGAPTASSQALSLTAARASEAPTLDPYGKVWENITAVDVPITAQNVTYPMGGGSVTTVKLQAVHFDNTLYVRATWADKTEDAAALDVAKFSDAVALEFPAKAAVSVPSFCMGQAGAGVNIWQWRADSQAGGPDALRPKAFPNALSDGVPNELANNPIYQPARSLGNPVAQGGDQSVQNLMAQAFGTLDPAPGQDVTGGGAWQNGTWSVVFRRPFQAATPDLANFSQGTATNMAVAVWNGSEGDRSGQKTVSQFVTLTISGSDAAHGGAGGMDWGSFWLALGIGAAAFIAGMYMLARAFLPTGARRV
ncbi:MAG: ethylbenzene dehydrogenase-related protein [Dehalococcoidia bacterium]